MSVRWRLCPCKLLSVSDLFFAMISLEERQRAEKRNRENQGHQFASRWFTITDEITATPWGDLEIYQYNGKYTARREAVDSSDSIEEVDFASTEFNPWQYSDCKV